MDKLDYDYNDKSQEYTRLNEEMLMRIKSSYGDGVMLASFYLIFYATVIGVFCEFFIKRTESLYILTISGMIFAFAFSIAIWILYAFAVKFKENFLAICNISEYLIFYHETSSSCKKWEKCHKDTMSDAAKHESKEYFLLALFSLLLFLVTMISVGWCLITMDNFNIMACLGVGVLDLVLLFFNIRYLLLIFNDTNLSKLILERNKIKSFYEEQSKEQGEDMPDPCDEEKISA